MSDLVRYPADGSGTGFDTAQPINAPARWTFPWPGYNDYAHGYWEQDYMVAMASFAPIALNSQATSQGLTCYLVGESSIRDIGGAKGMVTRTFAPAFANLPGKAYARVEPESFSCRFPGRYISSTFYPIAPHQETVSSEIRYAYFLPGVTTGILTPDDIPILRPYELTWIIDSLGNMVDTYADAVATAITDGGSVTLYTTLTNTQYNTIAYAAAPADRWVVAEPSLVRRWMGSIYERATRYVRAV